ncbi:hypothetical protein N0M98_17470 [Paenibacillus doosanensis]|uniref:hypothetical protein n=1 Tax=Paenibacillus doosanensis TaxID=1229154 RepID=UPI00217F36F3|nr:hypothetical protein [Paenibacillus doosanensis]MCS7461930.1 hypothetical protein [Paenibacillus doosanensis]
MSEEVEQALDAALRRWKAMAGSEMDEAEEAADGFEHAFYAFIDKLRLWYVQLEPKPASLDDALRLPFVEHIISKLPDPLYLNLETELELIVERKLRIDDEKYD